jgi:hypothetical protein
MKDIINIINQLIAITLITLFCWGIMACAFTGFIITPQIAENQATINAFKAKLKSQAHERKLAGTPTKEQRLLRIIDFLNGKSAHVYEDDLAILPQGQREAILDRL